MRIAIDIDNTITSIKDQLTNAAIEYAKKIGKYREIDLQNITDTYNDGNIYQKLFNFTYDELKNLEFNSLFDGETKLPKLIEFKNYNLDNEGNN